MSNKLTKAQLVEENAKLRTEVGKAKEDATILAHYVEKQQITTRELQGEVTRQATLIQDLSREVSKRTVVAHLNGIGRPDFSELVAKLARNRGVEFVQDEAAGPAKVARPALPSPESVAEISH